VPDNSLVLTFDDLLHELKNGLCHAFSVERIQALYRATANRMARRGMNKR
jgi:hypothetical protein